MWKLKIGSDTVREGGDQQWLRTVNNHLGRQVWEYHPELGTPEELQQIEDARKAFWDNRFETKHSSDLLMRIQVFAKHPILNFGSFIWVLVCFLFHWCLFIYSLVFVCQELNRVFVYLICLVVLMNMEIEKQFQIYNEALIFVFGYV